MSRARGLSLFLICSLLLCAVLFRGALWGTTLLAPLDIAPTLFSKYRYIDPNAGDVPANHHIIDQLTYDLPLQHTIYGAVHRGEIPWWDPYTYGGRPLLADAHVNGTDPVRLLCYVALPFVQAYNWNLIIKSILSGLGMFLLLRHLGFALHISLPLALTYQFAGCFAVFFGHPWVTASFVAYPFLWIVWSKCNDRMNFRLLAAAVLLVAWVFYCGNLQSHVYLPIFAACFLLAYGFQRGRLSFPLLATIAGSGLFGAMLAAPVLWPEMEFFRLSVRGVAVGATQFAPVSHGVVRGTGATFLAGAFPWLLGTFRTIDLGKFAGSPNAGFVIYLGSAGALLALLARHGNAPRPALRLARFLVVVYLIICSTPLLDLLYTRIAPLAVIGLTVAAAAGIATIERAENRARFRKVALLFATLAIVTVVLLNVFAFAVYPRLKEKIRARAAEQMSQNASFDFAPALRAFQIENFPREISVRNPETWLALASVLALAVYLRFPRHSAAMYALTMTLNFLPVGCFFSRYVPHQPLQYWERLLAGGPEQQRVAALLRPNEARLLEEAPGLDEMLFPNDLAHLQQVHTVHGYSALQPLSPFLLLGMKKTEPAEVADYVYRNDARGLAAGDLQNLRPAENARYRADGAEVRIASETLETLALTTTATAPILRTDTSYPGWQAFSDTKLIAMEPVPPAFTLITPSRESATPVRIELRYQPTHFYLTSALAGTALIVAGVLSLIPSRVRS